MKNIDFDPENCSRCILSKNQLQDDQKDNASIYAAWTHCMVHLPAVCQTKLGACINLQWQDDKMKKDKKPPKNVVIDLICGFPVPERNTLSIYKGVLTSLLEEMPAGWHKVLGSHVSRDRVIPDDMEQMNDSTFDEDEHNFVGIKLLSWGPGQNYHLRPGQSVEVEQFSNDNTRRAYLILLSLIHI